MTKVNSGMIRLAFALSLSLAVNIFAAETDTVTLQLKNGDRLNGRLISCDTNQVVISTPWNPFISIPRAQIEQGLSITNPPAASPSAIAEGEPSSHPPEKAKIKAPNAASEKKLANWKWDLKLGASFLSGATEQEIFFGQTSATFTRNYKSNPKKFLRNKVEYRVDYGKTDGTESVNRMAGGNKIDFDVFGDFYGYASGGAGYDQIRKIALQYELGSGLGYHLLARKSLAADLELGLNYQYREGADNAPNREVIQGRIGQDLTWEVLPKITLSEKVAFLPFLDELGQYQLRTEGNLGFGIVRHLSLNLTLLNFYDTQPAPGVPNNDFQVRSSLGVNF